MSTEQEPDLEQLQGRLTQIDKSLAKAVSIRGILRGGQDIQNPRYNFQFGDYVDIVLKRGEAVLNIDQRTLPKLSAIRLDVTENIRFFENIRKLKRIGELQKLGAIDPEIYTNSIEYS